LALSAACLAEPRVSRLFSIGYSNSWQPTLSRHTK
jgi:hypothetical protein